VDNGRPFGDPQLELIPPLALWLIGLGIQVIWNRPRTPQDNAKVERCQGVLANWTEFEKCKDTFDLQIRLWQQAHFYNYDFPIPRKKYRKRIELFPNLGFTGVPWNPADFKLQRVLNLLAKANWERKVSTNGQITMYAQRFSVGTSYKHQQVSIQLCPLENAWQVYDDQANLIKAVPTTITKEEIWNLILS